MQGHLCPQTLFTQWREFQLCSSISKAFRSLFLLYHPDKLRPEDDHGQFMFIRNTMDSLDIPTASIKMIQTAFGAQFRCPKCELPADIITWTQIAQFLNSALEEFRVAMIQAKMISINTKPTQFQFHLPDESYGHLPIPRNCTSKVHQHVGNCLTSMVMRSNSEVLILHSELVHRLEQGEDMFRKPDFERLFIIPLMHHLVELEAELPEASISLGLQLKWISWHRSSEYKKLAKRFIKRWKRVHNPPETTRKRKPVASKRIIKRIKRRAM